MVRFRKKIYVPYGNELNNLILREVHVKTYLGHLGYQRTLTTVKKFYHWLNLKKEVDEFVSICVDFQQVKVGCKHLGDLLQPILFPEWKWEVTSMNFITSLLSTSKQHDSIMVMVKVAHFITIKSTN